MPSMREHPWTRFLVEGVVIVVSILLAFGIDAGWGLYQDRLDEREAIDQLVLDFRANAARLDTVRGTHEAARDASYEILARAGIGGDTANDVPTAELVFLSLRSWTYDPVLGGINSLVQSGRLGLLRNDSLRVAIAGWPDIVGDMREDERIESDGLFERVAPYLIERGAMSDVLLAGGKLNRFDMDPQSHLDDLLADSTYLQMMTWRINSLENLLLEVETVDQSVQHILRLLENS